MSNILQLDKQLHHIPYNSSTTAFYQFVTESNTNQNKLYQEIRECKLDEYGCRFNVWRMLMGVLSINKGIKEKIEEIEASRTTFRQKKTEAFSGISSIKKEAQGNIPKNPLMKVMVKTASTPEVDDSFLREEIRKDVERTYQELEFFQQESIIKLLSSILFIWCKRNPDVSYKQGMNEILASIVYVYFQEVYGGDRAPQGFSDLTEENKNIYILFNSIEYAESDIYAVFEKVMNVQNQMYKTETDSNLKGVINPNSKNNTPILQRIITIIDQKLKTLDIELFRTIKLQNVVTKSFLLRWIRCMHTREFTLESSFLIWDSIFLEFHESTSASKLQFDFIDAMCVAMFVYMRSLALNRESSNEILQIYQKYPSLTKGNELEKLISLAWNLSDSLKQNNTNNNSECTEKESPKADIKLQSLKIHDAKTSEKESPTKPEKKESHGEETKELVPELNFKIVLEPLEWQSLAEKLQKSLDYEIDTDARKYILEAVEILKSKVESIHRE